MFNHLKRRIPKNNDFVLNLKYDKASKEDLVHEVKRQSNLFTIGTALLFIMMFGSLLMFGIIIEDLGETYLEKLHERTIELSERLCFESDGEFVRYYHNSLGELSILCEMEDSYKTFIIRGE